MNITYLKEVNNVISNFMKENGFNSNEQNLGTYINDVKSYKIDYNDSKKLFSISVSPVDSEGNADNYSVISTWYFDEESHGAKDTTVIGEDFLETIAKDAGIKVIKTAEGNTKEVALPEKAAVGTEPTVEALAQKFLALFPQYKDAYKNMVAKYGEFLYVEFFKRYGIEKMKELYENESANKRQIVKYWNMLGDMHYEGTTMVGDIICTVIIAGSFGNTPEKFDEASEKYLANYPFLKTAGAAAVKNYKNNKKLRKALEV